MQKSPNEADRHIGKRIRLRRIALGMSQEKLADALGLTFQQIQKYEKGINRIGAGRLHEIGLILGVDVTYFFDGLLGRNALLNANDNVLHLVASNPHGAKLIELFASVEDSNIQRSIVKLVEAVLSARETLRS
ncbi:helix-turn-helix domain-containing protein [Microvirga sp. HBU67558]|uniref:helix-turn-helix domain-containing protein n=1 Tax=Microvirga yunnanensis TaxID=2953740 RepID=UPI001B37BDF9|nr:MULTISPECIES: helix-turn-helix domain-containing protein [unclassified Microvirga]MBQ0822463.1 helix-turn-helix domain-containing protein [Microvirga sp. HBU67558]